MDIHALKLADRRIPILLYVGYLLELWMMQIDMTEAPKTFAYFYKTEYLNIHPKKMKC